jgi:hypothetical protein
MKTTALLELRLANQQLSAHNFSKPEEVVAWMGALQAQEYAQSQWAIGVRLPGLQDTDIEQAIAEKRITRTWCVRGTLHLVHANDVHWLLTLLAPRIISGSATRYKNLELDEKTLQKTQTILSRTLKNNEPATRDELTAVFHKAGIEAKGERLTHILYRAAMDQLICIGPKRGNTGTYTLLHAPVAKPFKDRPAAVTELAKRYFLSRGPATLSDFVLWCGLTIKEAREGLEAVKPLLTSFTLQQKEYWMNAQQPATAKPDLYCLPGFDEYVLGYEDKSHFLDAQHKGAVYTTNGIFNPVIVHKGAIIGTWRRTFNKDTVIVELQPFKPLPAATLKKISTALQPYASFCAKQLSIKTEA